MSADLFAHITSKARQDKQMTSAEFDYSLAMNDGKAGGAIYDACYAYAYADQFPVTDIAAATQRAGELQDSLRPWIEQRTVEASARSYTGWSTASGGPIRYATSDDEYHRWCDTHQAMHGVCPT